jgi:hypothetical protein
LKKNNPIFLFLGEIIETYTNRQQFYFDTVTGDTIKNLYSPYMIYLIHIKLRLGSCLLLQAEQNHAHSDDHISYWQNALKSFYLALELNRVLAERNIGIEIELKYRIARCMRELLIKRQVSIKDVVEAYVDCIQMSYSSTHDLGFMKNCYLELAMAFISLLDVSLVSGPTGDKTKRMTPNSKSVIEGELDFRLS